MSADQVRSSARAGQPGVGTLDAAGGPASWCRGTVRATRRVADLDARLDAVCAGAPRTPTLVRGPVLGRALDECLRRFDGVDVPAGPDDATGTGWDDRPRRRADGPGGSGRAWPGVAEAVPDPRELPSGRVPPEPHPEPRREASGALASRRGRGAASARPAPADHPPAGVRVTVDRLRALAGSPSPVGLDDAGRASRRGPGAGVRTVGPVGRRPAGATSPGTRRSPAAPPAVTGDGHAAAVAARVLRRVSGSPGSAAALARSVLRPGEGPADQALVDVLVRWSAWPGPEAEAADDGSTDARSGTPAPGGTRRRRRGRGPVEPGSATGGPASARRASTGADSGVRTTDPAGPAGAPEPAAPRRPFTPAADEHPLRSPSRFAEQPTRPRRLTDLVDRPADEDAAGDAGPGTDGVGLRPGLARAAVDTSAATGVGGTVPTVSAPELERVLARVLRDAASRHGIEV